MKIGFDNDKYLAMQSEHIRERIQKFDNKLYLEFGGKLFDDYHASRVLPGFQPDSKLQMLLQLKDQAPQNARRLCDTLIVAQSLRACNAPRYLTRMHGLMIIRRTRRGYAAPGEAMRARPADQKEVKSCA